MGTDLHIMSVWKGGCPDTSFSEDLAWCRRAAGVLPDWWPRLDAPDGVRLAAHPFTLKVRPTRMGELGRGSVYWVMSGRFAGRLPIIANRPIPGREEGGRFADWFNHRHGWLLWLDPRVVRVSPRAIEPFRGWRYLPATSAPEDIAGGAAALGELPPKLASELRELGLA